MRRRAEYIWIDGSVPTGKLRSKTRVLGTSQDPPEWGFDGSSTSQAVGSSSDCILVPVWTCPDPLRGGEDILVLCEVLDGQGRVHASNTRARTSELAARYGDLEAWFGIEQEYTFFASGRPLGWPRTGFPAPQGPYYCGVGGTKMPGRAIVEAHLDACLRAGIAIEGTNAEVMMAQWEFQVGPLGPLEVADSLWVARWLLERIAEDHGVEVSWAAKPMPGDWNGAGAHTNVSTRKMRDEGGMTAIEAACAALGARAAEHVAGYGHGIQDRLTGAHETAPWNEFSWGVGHRGASIRIPAHVARAGRGYLEDRRPNANMDPYVVVALLLETIGGAGL